MSPPRPRWRSAALLLPSGALAVHQLRYLLAFGGDAGDTLARSGHGYLVHAGPLLAALVAMALGRLTLRLSAAWRRGAPDGARASGRRVWLAFTLILLAVYAGQELAEGLVAGGPVTGPAALAAHGGWLVLGLAPAIAGVLALALRGADAVVALAARAGVARRKGERPRRPAPARGLPVTVLVARTRRLLLGAIARRGPPGVLPLLR